MYVSANKASQNLADKRSRNFAILICRNDQLDKHRRTCNADERASQERRTAERRHDGLTDPAPDTTVVVIGIVKPECAGNTVSVP